ncbi:hypothetical protein BCON_0082g00090 [Botryotinia convoluta]|uniref:Uncharacterized protein n=1 Tax=Botryotinia convoluta TaxID=54673 RepID=A0A4Z1IHG5_9HELO|nr:hypothetical protein BCON_0082g00090 [Botryotinia convoluta]
MTRETDSASVELFIYGFVTPFLSFMANFAVSVENSKTFTKASAHGLHQFASEVLRRIHDVPKLDGFVTCHLSVRIPAPIGRDLWTIYRMDHWVTDWEDVSRNVFEDF